MPKKSDASTCRDQVSFADLAKKYANCPEFIGIEIVHPNQPGAFDDTLIHLVSRRGIVEDLLVLLDSGGDVNVLGDLGNTPLHSAVLTNQAEIAKLLLKHGAKPNIKNELGETPYDIAADLQNKAVMKLLR